MNYIAYIEIVRAYECIANAWLLQKKIDDFSLS